jgi:hypothetical protein
MMSGRLRIKIDDVPQLKLVQLNPADLREELIRIVTSYQFEPFTSELKDRIHWDMEQVIYRMGFDNRNRVSLDIGRAGLITAKNLFTLVCLSGIDDVPMGLLPEFGLYETYNCSYSMDENFSYRVIPKTKSQMRDEKIDDILG